MPERIRTSPPKCLYKKAMKRDRIENLKKQIKKPPQAIADSKIMSTFATAIERDSDGKMKSWCVSSVG